MSVIGIDTSNYTTSIAFFDGEGGENCSRLLPVRQGELGLRQSDAVFAHIKSLPELSGRRRVLFCSFFHPTLAMKPLIFCAASFFFSSNVVR